MMEAKPKQALVGNRNDLVPIHLQGLTLEQR
jgi:hypothetical protein